MRKLNSIRCTTAWPSLGVILAVALIGASIPWSGARAGDLIYRPINPAFGGDTFMGNYLISSAQEQRIYGAPDTSSLNDPVEDFSRTVTSRLLSRISTEIADSILGEDAAESGRFQVGDTTLTFARSGDQVTIDIVDAVTGSSTTVEVPIVTSSTN